MTLFKTTVFAGSLILACSVSVPAEEADVPAEINHAIFYQLMSLKSNSWCRANNAYSDQETASYFSSIIGLELQKLLTKAGLRNGITEDSAELVIEQFQYRLRSRDMVAYCSSQELLAQVVSETLTDTYVKLDDSQ